jgi:hypothetical protein
MNTATLTSQVSNTDGEAGGCSNDIVSTSSLKKISWLLAKYNIKASYTFVKKNILMLRSTEEKLGLNIAGVHFISCKSGKVHVG